MASRGRFVTPLRVEATLVGAVQLHRPVALDALLMAAVAVRDDLPPIGVGERIDIEIPIARERGVYLASVGIYDVEARERRFLTKRFPLAEAQAIGDPKMRAIKQSAGLTKNFRIPTETQHLRGDRVVWFAVGDVGAVRELLTHIHYLGKKRSVGLGRVAEWKVAEIADTWEGFPVTRDGKALRNLPLDWPGLREPRRGHAVLAPPYWEQWRAEECAVP